MARSKKSRKVGLIGVRKDPDFKPSENRKSDSPRPKSIKASQRVAAIMQSNRKFLVKSAEKKDPRIGSKTNPIGKTSVTPTPAQKKKYATPAQELAALEADQRLSDLLDKLDDDKPLTREQQAYVDEKMARHRILCDLLGIVEDDDEDDDIDPFSDLDAINIDDFKQ